MPFNRLVVHKLVQRQRMPQNLLVHLYSLFTSFWMQWQQPIMCWFLFTSRSKTKLFPKVIMCTLSMQKFRVVVEKYLKCFEECCQRIIRELPFIPHFEQLLEDHFVELCNSMFEVSKVLVAVWFVLDRILGWGIPCKHVYSFVFRVYTNKKFI
ncbi:uncharacterized protein LOC130769644 isoform X1 [Actinidia eriantha]|uniref:uncharacterized protein LOC130769644 isoform X1 n=1 Tax=Actinidia eriantha TaxID=165200 RepID=UPI00258B7FCD|nr:uncharacterized protein LOC130769644 isoform X1 [Actinidia eriantha]